MAVLFFVLMIGLELKHFVADYLLQPGWILAGKGDFRKPGGYAHAGIHVAFSALVLAIAGTPLAPLLAIIAAEFVLIRNEMSASTIRRLASVDRHYGLVALLVIVVGVCRVLWGLKGWEFYVYNWVFWAKMAAFAAVGLLSIVPTMRFISWNRQATADPGYRVPEAEYASVRTHVRWEALVFLLIPVFAAAMARGYGL